GSAPPRPPPPPEQPAAGRPPAPPPPPIGLLVDQLSDLFPRVSGEVVEVRDGTLTLDAGKKKGVQPGLEVELYREGREIKHPKTGEVLGRTEEALGKVRVTEVQEGFALAPAAPGSAIQPGDRFRVSLDKANLFLLSFVDVGVRGGLVEAAIQELLERLTATGRFRVTMGDPIAVSLAQQGIKPEEFLQGKGVKEAAQRFKADNLLA